MLRPAVAKIDVGSRRAVFWDLGGQSSMRGVWNHYLADANAVMFVVDAADPARMDEAARAHAALLEQAELAGVPVLLFANKQDLREAQSVEEVAKRFSPGDRRGRAWRAMGVSALTWYDAVRRLRCRAPP